ncbi:MAG: hypothetical protein ACK2T3_04090, partial [Candidatus Promineifilaceae bacterium]
RCDKQADREEPQPIKRGVILFWITGAILFGLGLSAWFWLPALAEQSFAQLGPVTSGYFHFENHFRSFDLVQFDPIFNYDVAAGKSFSMGLFQAVIAAAGLIIIIYYWWRHRRSATDSQSNENLPPLASILFIVISLVIASVMITALSRQLWENLPLLKFTQFPWRFLSVQAFAGALASGGLALLPWRKFIIPLILIPYLVVSILGLQLDFLAIAKNEITAENLAQYEWFTGNIGSTVSSEYLPQTVDPRPFTSAWLNEGNRDFVQIIEGEAGSVSNQERHTVHQTWSVEVTTQSAVVLFPTIYWPGWEASIDGVEAPISAAPGSGLILMEIPSGQHQIEFDLARTSIRWTADAMGLIFAAAAVVLFIWSARSAYRWRKLIACVLAAVLILLIFWLFPERTYPESDQSWDFLQLAYLNHSPEGIEFSDGAVLDSYSYSSSNVTPGDMLSINLVWEEQPHEEITIDLVSPAANRHSDAPIVASITISGLSIKNAAVLELPSNSPAGLYLPRLTIEGSSALTESGEKRGDLFLRPILIQDIAETVSGSIHALDARTVSVQDVNEDTLEVQLQWLTKVALTKNLNYSLRLVDSAGIQVAQVDSQPGYGYLPSSQWRSDQWIDDWIALPLPPDPGEDFYSLVVRLYDPGTGQVELIRRLGEITWSNGDIFYTESAPSFSIPSAEHEVEITFGEQISLLGYDLDQSGQYMTLKVYWRALVDGLENYYRFIHLVDPSSGEIIAQSDSMPRFDTYPTSQWVKGEVIEDNVVIDLSDIPAGTYQLALGWYSQSTDPSCPGCTTRLAAADHEGRQLPEDSYQFTIGIPIE